MFSTKIAEPANVTSILDHSSASGIDPPSLHSANSFIFSHKTVLSLSCALTFAVLALVGLTFYYSPVDVDFAQDWQNQNWIQGQCQVDDVGIAYRGNCHAEIGAHGLYFQECLGPSETELNVQFVRERWGDTPAGLCEAMGDRDYWFNDHGERVPWRTSSFGTAQLEQASAPENCKDSYLLWAALRLSSEMGFHQRCAYRFGAAAPSITDNWVAVKQKFQRLRTAKEVHSQVACWALKDDACVVAFHDEESHGTSIMFMRIGGIVCCLLWTLFMFLAIYWHTVDLGCWGPPDTSVSTLEWYHHALPTEEPPLSSRVRHVLEVAGARFGEETPSASGCSTIRATFRDRVEIMAPDGIRQSVSRNVATDFLSEG